ncbi:MAG: hypothetical protein Q8P27_01000 [Candidatus Peregrinibacteria bacterium]|nr:hypothetical protein [Candidatus Peregrinibacteria bacterium]
MAVLGYGSAVAAASKNRRVPEAKRIEDTLGFLMHREHFRHRLDRVIAVLSMLLPNRERIEDWFERAGGVLNWNSGEV